MAATNKNNHDDDDEISKEGAGRHDLGRGILYQYQGFWRSAVGIESLQYFQQNFKDFDTDLILATQPKSGSIWLKALALNQLPLFKQLPPTPTAYYHSLLDFTKTSTTPDDHDSRLVATHVPYASLAESIKNPATNCKIVYLCRNPQETFISLWMFMNKVRHAVNNNNNFLSIDEAFEFFCEGVSEFGPFWDHVLGYWKESSENPQKVLFLRYEDLKKEPNIQVKKLAEFMGYSFSAEEETHGVIEDILSLCSFENLKNLDVNKNGYWQNLIENKAFFKKGEVGDSKNYLTPMMVERIHRLTEEKMRGSGLVFEY
ncbi:hypothetical protein MKW98_022399 [Papaver atlanticum]|uniref:Sulfotransferase n=1 Tax=Papaver atlanticum TaxID=357466 RepID=A0AAD4XD81_9MAGN|nr:hypothetical protein MKW98_022399 [Papaver atlanticum]